ncbi:hypothetical protein THAOC_23676, partial [Thalassiosira oceanica]
METTPRAWPSPQGAASTVWRFVGSGGVRDCRASSGGNNEGDIVSQTSAPPTAEEPLAVSSGEWRTTGCTAGRRSR